MLLVRHSNTKKLNLQQRKRSSGGTRVTCFCAEAYHLYLVCFDTIGETLS